LLLAHVLKLILFKFNIHLKIGKASFDDCFFFEYFCKMLQIFDDADLDLRPFKFLKIVKKKKKK
jgi:hypothetical protein